MMDFGQALHVLRNGGRVRRDSWNDGVVLYLVPGSKFVVNREPLLSILGEGTEISYQPHIDMLIPPGSMARSDDALNNKVAVSRVWDVTQLDVMAMDWEEAPVA